jgi:hypothetical protein
MVKSNEITEAVIISVGQWRSLVKLRNALWAQEIQGKEKQWANLLHIIVNEAHSCEPNEECIGRRKQSPFKEKG